MEKSLVDKLKPLQIAYNIQMEKILSQTTTVSSTSTTNISWVPIMDKLLVDEFKKWTLKCEAKLMFGTPEYWWKHSTIFYTHKRFLFKTLKLVGL